MSPNLTSLLQRILDTESLAGKRITIIDPEDTRYRQVYEDLDEETPGKRNALITLFPEHAKGCAKGEDSDGLVVVTHIEAVRDLRRMITRHGYVVVKIERDIFFNGTPVA